MWKVASCGLAVLLCAAPVPALADFVISFDANTLIAPGNSGFVNVYISSTIPAGQTLNNTNFEFALSTAGATRLEFTNSPAPASDPTFASSSYVFNGNSGDQANSFPLGTASTNTVPNDRFVGGDFTNNGADVVVNTTPKLLAMVPVTAATALPPTTGNTFTISLVPTSASGFSGNTGFGDSSSSFFPFTSGSGTITIAAVPEPGTLVLVGAGVGLALLASRLRARSSKAAP